MHLDRRQLRLAGGDADHPRHGPGPARRSASWTKVLRHELMMGLVLGVTLGVIGFIRGAATPDSIRGGSKEYETPIAYRCRRRSISIPVVPAESSSCPPSNWSSFQPVDKPIEVTLPKDGKMEVVEAGGQKEYRFPAKSAVREPLVDRWQLAKVIAFSVAGICLWGTIVGSMLPFGFRWLGADPGVASSPFVIRRLSSPRSLTVKRSQRPFGADEIENGWARHHPSRVRNRITKYWPDRSGEAVEVDAPSGRRRRTPSASLDDRRRRGAGDGADVTNGCPTLKVSTSAAVDDVQGRSSNMAGRAGRA